MRIISGKFKGRSIKFPNSKLVRPTTGKVKESLFNFLVHNYDLDGIKVCDVYAGSGSLGLEALSRGASEVHFVEKDYHVLKILEENISSLSAGADCKLYRLDSVRFSKLPDHDVYNLILADPPFFKDDIHSAVRNFIERKYLAESGILIVERSVQTQKKDVESFEREPFKRIGDSLIYLFENTADNII
jgi:16S rRNA (guanine966-N2)-methyltransferase